MYQSNSEIKTIVTVPWANNENSWKSSSDLGGEAQAYSKIPLIFRATRLRCNSLTRVPRNILSLEDDRILDAYEFEKTFPMRDLLWLSEAAFLLAGVAYDLKLRNYFRYGKGLQWLNPFTVQSQLRDGQLQFWQQLPTGERLPREGYWTVDDFIYLKDFNPLDDLGPGISAARVALGDAKIMGSVTTFLANFFSSDALPVTMVVIPKGASKAEVDRVENWFKKRIQGFTRGLQRVLGVTSDIKIEKLTPELKTFEFDKVDNHAVDNVAWAFDIPKTILTSASSNFATAATEYRSFLDYTIIPRCRYYESMLNPFLAEFGQRLEFNEQELPEMQEDEVKRADALDSLVTAGVPLEAALDILGYDISPEAQKILDKHFAEKKKEPPPPNPLLPADGNLIPANGGTQLIPQNGK